MINPVKNDVFNFQSHEGTTFEVGLGKKREKRKKGEEANAVFVSFFGKRRDGTAYPPFS